MRYRYSRSFHLAIGILVWCMSVTSFASSQVDDLLAKLSNAKAELEGRAIRIQNCPGLRSTPALEVLKSQFDDARNPYNSRLDAWIFVITAQPSKPLEDTLEASKLNEAFFKVNEFKDAADEALRKGPCSRRVIFKEILIATAPLLAQPVVDALVNLFKQAAADPKIRSELIKALERQKISAWRGITSYVVYDWTIEEVISSDKITENVLRKASTSIYVNKWALEVNPGPSLVVDKLPPNELPAHMLYTGKLKDLKRYTGETTRSNGEFIPN